MQCLQTLESEVVLLHVCPFEDQITESFKAKYHGIHDNFNIDHSKKQYLNYNFPKRSFTNTLQ